MSLLTFFYSLAFLLSCSNAFTSPSMFVSRAASKTMFGQTSVDRNLELEMVFGNKKTKTQKDVEEVSKYWQGDWVCKDCGYIYNRAECAGMYFEEQGAGFRCPQCSGPRRRYAKKVGDVVGTTLDGGDAPILLFSFGGVIATIIFGIWATQNL
mmetsp:Transcript_20550/g.29328  ORF Transcript_20550/g.29328 Transcript_20550/m.29328 type:complete len:153 (+) Transcript_20550:90-548(+)